MRKQKINSLALIDNIIIAYEKNDRYIDCYYFDKQWRLTNSHIIVSDDILFYFKSIIVYKFFRSHHDYKVYDICGYLNYVVYPPDYDEWIPISQFLKEIIN